MSKPRPFPAVTGGCRCGLVRYRMETAPLFCHACHCYNCQKQTGSVFAAFASIEAHRVTSIGQITPQNVLVPKDTGTNRVRATCPECKTVVWENGAGWHPSISDVNIGTLDMPSLMPPDIHLFIESKVAWLPLPEGARTSKGMFDMKEVWPKSSLARYDACIAKYNAAQEDAKEKGDKTPTAESPEEKEADEDFERRTDAIERELQERLEKLSIKLNEQEKA